MTLPTTVNVLGAEYAITYVSKPSEVDIHGRESMWGQCDYWTRTIRIFNRNRADADVWQTIIHELLHAIGYELKLRINKDENHDELDLLATGLRDVFVRNKWLRDFA